MVWEATPRVYEYMVVPILIVIHHNHLRGYPNSFLPRSWRAADTERHAAGVGSSRLRCIKKYDVSWCFYWFWGRWTPIYYWFNILRYLRRCIHEILNKHQNIELINHWYTVIHIAYLKCHYLYIWTLRDIAILGVWVRKKRKKKQLFGTQTYSNKDRNLESAGSDPFWSIASNGSLIFRLFWSQHGQTHRWRHWNKVYWIIHFP